MPSLLKSQEYSSKPVATGMKLLVASMHAFSVNQSAEGAWSVETATESVVKKTLWVSSIPKVSMNFLPLDIQLAVSGTNPQSLSKMAVAKEDEAIPCKITLPFQRMTSKPTQLTSSELTSDAPPVSKPRLSTLVGRPSFETMAK